MRAHTLANQRWDTYIVISIPNRNSTACGVSHFMSKLLKVVTGPMVLPMPSSPNQRHHETRVMIFMSVPNRAPGCRQALAPAWAPRRRGPDTIRPMRLRTRLNLVVAGLSAAFVIVLIAAEVQSTRNSVREEIEAANRVASQLLGRLAAVYSQVGGPDLVLQFR